MFIGTFNTYIKWLIAENKLYRCDADRRPGVKVHRGVAFDSGVESERNAIWRLQSPQNLPNAHCTTGSALYRRLIKTSHVAAAKVKTAFGQFLEIRTQLEQLHLL